MLVVLEITTGGDTGRKVWLSPGQSLDVGRTEDAAFVVACDSVMAQQHFEIACQRTDCRIRTRSDSATWLNGQPIRESNLRDGDKIVAGATSFTVHIELEEGIVPPTKKSSDVVENDEPLSQPERTGDVGPWRFQHVPEGWHAVPGRGLRIVASDGVASLVLVSESRLPPTVALRDHLEVLVNRLLKQAAGCCAAGPQPIAIGGADEAFEIVLVQQCDGPERIVQRQIFARRNALMAVATLAALETKLIELHPHFDVILAGMSLARKGDAVRRRKPEEICE